MIVLWRLVVAFCFVAIIHCEECPTGWIRVQDKCYYNLPIFVTRSKNIDFCDEYNAKLVTIENEFERKVITAMAPAGFSYWMSGVSANLSKDFLMNTINAMKHLQSNTKSNSCIAIDGGSLNNVPCDSQHFVFCQLNINSEILSEHSQCDDDWIRFQDKCFTVNEVRTAIIDNELYCRKIGATMVTINSELENAVIDAMTKRETFYWLGGHRRKSGNQTFEWFDGTEFGFTKWHTHKQDTRYGDQPEQYENNTCIFNGNWHDCGYSHDRYPHLCQKYILKEKSEQLENKIAWLTKSFKLLNEHLRGIGNQFQSYFNELIESP